jgi:hypothetical protein
MAKGKRARPREKQSSLFPELDQIISVLVAEKRQDLVILIIPSHDKKEVELKDQDMWASAAMDLFADLFGSATAFKTFAGIYKTSDGKVPSRPADLDRIVCGP